MADPSLKPGYYLWKPAPDLAFEFSGWRLVRLAIYAGEMRVSEVEGRLFRALENAPGDYRGPVPFPFNPDDYPAVHVQPVKPKKEAK